MKDLVSKCEKKVNEAKTISDKAIKILQDQLEK